MMKTRKKHPMLGQVLITILIFGFLLAISSKFLSNAARPSKKMKILLGVLTTASKFERRGVLRMAYGLQLPTPEAEISIRFVLGKPKNEMERTIVNSEILHHKDLILLDCKENLNEGKTFAYLESVSKNSGVNYVMKTDDDSYVRLENLVQSLQNLSRSDLYYGYILPCENMDSYKGYMAGMGYLLSWDLVEWIGMTISKVSKNLTIGTEDQLVGEWLDKGNKAKFRVNKKPMFYDHPEFGGACAHELTKDTILLHQVKTLDRWVQVLDFFEGHRANESISLGF